MKIIILITAFIVAYFLIKRNKKSEENRDQVGNMVMCHECGFHVIEANLCVSKEQINQCPNKR